eukprot:TRINITY_DN6604_c0_g1_i1.p1 TRINITY_DN6604_c0_g1~~TRINITY_DN6604_c0_g1_i1.p1  ORF type:complete len:124 (+),score=22.56 TRINITY_DN6604_c0_g1_i1:45-374(+)
MCWLVVVLLCLLFQFLILLSFYNFPFPFFSTSSPHSSFSPIPSSGSRTSPTFLRPICINLQNISKTGWRAVLQRDERHYDPFFFQVLRSRTLCDHQTLTFNNFVRPKNL